MENDRLLISRFQELSSRAYNREEITHSDFLTLDEQSLFLNLVGPKGGTRINGASFSLVGEEEGWERKFVLFAPETLSEDEIGCEADALLSCLRIAPKAMKFAEELGHRDFLGALMSLGFERKEFGDLVVRGKEAYLIAFRKVVPQVVDELKEVRHTAVVVEEVPLKEATISVAYEEKVISVSQSRLDAVLKEVYGLSREDGKKTVEDGLVYIDGRLVSQPSFLLSPGERVSCRGRGKFIFDDVLRESRKGRLLVKIKVFK